MYIYIYVVYVYLSFPTFTDLSATAVSENSEICIILHKKADMAFHCNNVYNNLHQLISQGDQAKDPFYRTLARLALKTEENRIDVHTK